MRFVQNKNTQKRETVVLNTTLSGRLVMRVLNLVGQVYTDTSGHTIYHRSRSEKHLLSHSLK